MPPLRITMVCSGNICRSPMAEALCRELLARIDVEAVVDSAGTLGIVGYPAAAAAIEALNMLGIDLRGHVSRVLDEDVIAAADFLVVMSPEHSRTILLRDRSARAKLVELWSYTDEPGRLDEIDDPVGGEAPDFIECRDVVLECVRNWIAARFAC
jgi:protein-tyrosine-phosphatase